MLKEQVFILPDGYSTRLKLPSASIKPDNQALKYGIKVGHVIMCILFELLYLLLRFSKLIALGFDIIFKAKFNWCCLRVVIKGYLAKIIKHFVKSALEDAIQVTYLLLRSITTRPPTIFCISYNILTFWSKLDKDIIIRTLNVFRTLDTVIVPSPSNNPTQKDSIYDFSNLKFLLTIALRGSNITENWNRTYIVLLLPISCNATSSDALARITPVTMSLFVYRIKLYAPDDMKNSVQHISGYV